MKNAKMIYDAQELYDEVTLEAKRKAQEEQQRQKEIPTLLKNVIDITHTIEKELIQYEDISLVNLQHFGYTLESTLGAIKFSKKMYLIDHEDYLSETAEDMSMEDFLKKELTQLKIKHQIKSELSAEINELLNIKRDAEIGISTNGEGEVLKQIDGGPKFAGSMYKDGIFHDYFVSTDEGIWNILILLKSGNEKPVALTIGYRDILWDWDGSGKEPVLSDETTHERIHEWVRRLIDLPFESVNPYLVK